MSISRSDHMASGIPPSYGGSPLNRSQSPGGANSPVDPSGQQSSSRPPFGLVGGIMAGNSRSGAGSPSHDLSGSSRLFSKRAREIQAQEGIPSLPLNPWGAPPTSGHSTPLRENIPESPTDGFPDFGQLPTPDTLPQTRRARAGTVPSRFPGGSVNGLLNIPGLASAKSARVTPSQSPFKSPSPTLDQQEGASSGSTLLSRLRAGSLPQRSPFTTLPGSSSPFGPSIFSSWNPAGVGRERGSTLASIVSAGSNGPSSPSHSQFSREGAPESDVHMRTLDYLGLAETPNPSRAQLAASYMANDPIYTGENRFRSYSVNNKDKYADNEDYGADSTVSSQYVAALQDQMAATNAAIQEHNRAVQAFATQAANRPRARTTGVLDTPGTRLAQAYANPGVVGDSASGDMRMSGDEEYDDLPQAMSSMGLGRSNSHNAGLTASDEPTLEGPTSALWLGGVPTSTTATTLIELFKKHGHILSARVLTHKNCGFVNFDRTESAVSAKASLNGEELFPGAGPIRINFAKPPSSSNTPGHDGIYPSPSPDLHAKGQDAAGTGNQADGSAGASLGTTTPMMPPLADLTTDILDMVGDFDATDDERATIAHNVQSAIQYTGLVEDISPIPEASHTRVHDAPKLRDIRKRIDNQLLSQPEIENIAIDMLPEIAELAADYLGNTVVQKLFESCSDQIKDAMLAEIAPHLAEIGTHKNGTWAAQKIIDVCKTPAQMSLIVEHLRPYSVPLFLDQFGNYVVQCCLKFGAPYNDFVFEAMLSRMWEISQGRFGARAMRACLESHHATKTQQKMLASAIALRGAQLATNANSALLLTWFLDTCTFPQRRSVMSPRLVPHLVYLCTHKVAYLTVLKIINQKAEAGARDTILQALFFTQNDQTLEAILSDHQSGATLIFKILTTPFFDEAIRAQVVENVKNVLVRIKAQPSQGYKRLMDEVGLSTRSAGPSREPAVGSDRQRPTSRHANMNGQQHSNQGNNGFYSSIPVGNGAGFDNGYGAQRTDGAELNMAGYTPYMYGAPGAPMAPAVGMPPLQYQQSMMNRAAPQMAYNYAPMQTPFPPFAPGPSPVDQYRQTMPNGSPIQPGGLATPSMQNGQAAFAPPGFNAGGYSYGGMPGAQSMAYVPQDQNNLNRPSRRGGRR